MADDSAAKLESFLSLAKGARGRAAAAVIADATAAPGVFAFGELLDVPHIKEARGFIRRAACEQGSERATDASPLRAAGRL